MIRRYLEFVKPYKYRIIATIIIGIIKFGIPMLILYLSNMQLMALLIIVHFLRMKISTSKCSYRHSFIYILDCETTN